MLLHIEKTKSFGLKILFLQLNMETIKRSIKINVLLCDTFPGRLPDDIPSYVSMHEILFSDAAGAVEFEVFMAMDGELPRDFHTDEIYMIPGCMFSAYDPLPWIEELQAWTREAVARGVFLVGICFGHQVIARALGGTVERYSGGWGTGIRESTVVDDSMLKYFTEGKLRLLYNHHDQVVTLPDGAIPLATSDFCRYEALRYGHQIVTFQGHPEYTPYYMDYYLHHLADGQSQDIINRALLSLQNLQHQGVEVARWIVMMFEKWLSQAVDPK